MAMRLFFLAKSERIQDGKGYRIHGAIWTLTFGVNRIKKGVKRIATK